ncbi:MAG: hypothetical protein OEV00_05640 [Acidobacteriota bacterium]|nr:hypothetical protein [Acidobacteriota bacterium]MDH3784797.1 hypothetical protein [Acidobacteriota bacterium]
MRGAVSFHPFDVGLFGVLLDPLIEGKKVNPEDYLDICFRKRVADWRSSGYRATIQMLLEEVEPPELPTEGSVWFRLRARVERLEYKPAAVVKTLSEQIEPDLHLHGRPFFITEGSADRVGRFCDEYLAAKDVNAIDGLVLEQLLRLDRTLGREIEAEMMGSPPAAATVHAELLQRLKEIFELAAAARQDGDWGNVGSTRPAREVLAEELPWRCVEAHAEAVPFWVAHDVDGLAGLCEATGIEPPPCLVSARPLFAHFAEPFPALLERLSSDLTTERQLGGYVPANDIPELLTFLAEQGARIIQAATRHGVGKICSVLLRKIRECATFASLHGTGYLEASSLDHPPLPDNDA